MPLVNITPAVRPGTLIRAEQFNALREAVLALANSFASIRGANGVLVQRSGLNNGSISTTISLAERVPIFRMGRIVARYGVDGSGVGTVSTISYDINVLRSPEADQFLAVAPDFGRPTYEAGVEIQAASVGDPVIVWRLPVGDGSYEQYIQVLSESDAPMVPCDGG